ncbi:MAG: GAF domain-containing protein [Chloroflexi bacterium]|nr:GAF domain-containing protein [Chloroflexota bacterium]
MIKDQIPLRSQTRKTLQQEVWQRLTAPPASLRDIGERREAQLAAAFLFIIAALNLIGGFARIPRLGFEEAFQGGLGLSLTISVVAYGLSRTRWYRAAVFLFAVNFSSTAYLTIVQQGNEADFGTLVLIYVPISLIVAASFLSPWAVFLLTGLNIGGMFLTHYYSVEYSPNFGATAGIITTIGVVLSALSNFRVGTEALRLNEARRINHELEELTQVLEKRVTERTAELETANRQISQRASQLQTITGLSETIAQLKDLNELFPAVTRLISERFGFYHVGIFLVDGDRQFAILQAANSEGGRRMLERGHRLKLGTGVVGVAAQTGLPRIALDVGADAVFFNNPDLPDTRSEAALPLISRGETIGVLDVQSTEPGAFSQEDLQILTALANQVSIAFENTRLLSETRAALVQVQEVYNEFTRTEWTRAVTQAEQAGFRYRAGRIELLENALSTPEVLSAVRSGHATLNQVDGSKVRRAAVAVPVKLRGEVIGVLHVEANESSKEWQADEISLVEAVAERAALAMENARLFQDARRRAAKEQLISSASAKIGSAFSLENILQTTADELERVLGGSEVLIQFQRYTSEE